MAQVSSGKGVEGLDAICQSPEYRAWVLQFTAHRYIGQDTQAFRARVREAVAARASALDKEKLALLQDTVIDRLTGAADPVSTRAADDQKAAAHTRHAIEDLVTLQFPLPIAVCYQKLAEIEDGGSAFSLLLDAFESLVHMLFTIALSAYWRDSIPSPKLNETLLTFFGGGKWSPGHIMGALRETARSYRQRSDRLLCPELVESLFTTSGGPSRLMGLLEGLGTLRNTVYAHGWQRDEQRLAPLAVDSRPLLDEALSRCGWLRNYSLWVPRVIDGNGLVTSIDVLRGVRRQKDRKTSFQLEAKDLDINGGDIKPERTLLLVNEERAAYLPLFPLSLSHVQRQSVRSFFLRELKWKERCEFLELAHYETFESGEGGDKREYRVRRLEDAVTKLEAKVRDLTHALQSQAKVLDEIKQPVAERPDLDLPRVRSEQELHLKNFAGRAGSLTALVDWARRPDAGGYLVVLGPPGQGKSAVLAQFAHQEPGCIFHMIKSERNPQRFLQFLIWQCAQQLEEALPESSYLGDVPHLIDVLFRSLARLRECRGRALLILDALDELEMPTSLIEVLPRRLENGIHVLFSSRPDDALIESFRRHIPDAATALLPELSPDDLLPFLEKYLDPKHLKTLRETVDLNAVYQRMQGSPLFLKEAIRWMVHRVEAGVPIDVSRIPNAAETWCAEFYDDIAERKPGASPSARGYLKSRIIRFLAVALEPLTIEDVRGLLQADGHILSLEETRDLLMEMSEYLLVIEGERYKPWYELFSEYIQEKVLGQHDWQKMHEIFCRWLKTGPRSRYYLQNYPAHLIRAGDFDGLRELAGTRFLQDVAENFSTIDALSRAREIAFGFVHAGDAYGDALLDAAYKYCDLFEKLSAEPVSFVGLIERRELGHLVGALRVHDRDEFYQGMLMSAVTPMLYEIGELNLAQEARGYGFGQVVRKYRSGVASMERHDPAILILLNALYEGLDARYPPLRESQPQETVQQPPANEQPARKETAFTRPVAVVRRWLVWILGIAKRWIADTNTAPAPVNAWQRPQSVTARASAPLLLRVLAVITGARAKNYCLALFWGGLGWAATLYLASLIGLPTVNIATAVVFAAGVLGAIALLMWPVRALIRMWLRRASDRIDRLIAQLDAGVDDCSSHRHIARAVRFAASLRLFSPEHPRWAAYLPGWTARLFRSVSGAPAAAADVTLHAAALGDSVGDALIAEFRALPPELRKAIHRSMVARAFPAAAHQQILRILAATADPVESSSGLSSGPVSDYGPIVEYLHYCMKVSENEQGYPSRLFGAMSLSGMGKALLLAMQRKDQRARFGFVTQWATLIAWTGVPAAVGTSRTETPLFLAICTPGYALVLCGLLLVMGAFLGIVAFTHMLIGRPHDPFGLSLRAHGLTAAEHRQLVSERMREPDFSFAHFWGMVPGLRNASFHIRAGWLTRPFANRHIRETVLAQKYMRDEPIDSEFFVSFPKRSVQDVLWKLLKRGYLAPKTIVYLMDDRQLLNRMRKAKPKSVPAPDPSRDDRQLASVLPLHPAAYFFSIAVLAVAMSLLWWSLVWWKLPWSLMSIDQQFWVLSVPYGALPAVVVALLIAAAQSAYVLIPDKAWPQTLLRQSPQRRAVVYQVVLAGASFFALSWATQMMREAAARAGWLTPTNVSNDAFWLIFVVIWISALLAPVMLAQWRNSTLFYPSAADVWRKRAMSTLVVAALLVCLAGVGRMIILESIDSESSASYRKANELYGKREYDGALAKLDNALRFNAGNVDAYLLRCSVYAHKARDEEAATDCSEAMRRDSVAARKYSGVAERRGREAYSKKAYDEAIVELNTALLLDPESASAFLMRCSAHSGKDNLAEAIRDCTSATTRDPKLANAYGRLGWFYLLVSNPTQAIIASQRGLELEKDAAWMRTNLAHGFLFAHQYEAARAVYIDNKDVVLGAGQAFAQAVLDDFKEFRRRKIVPSDVEPDMAKIEALLTAGKSG